MSRVGTSRQRHLRHSTFDKMRKRKTLPAFLGLIVTALSATANATVFTAANATNELTAAGHSLIDRSGPYLVSNAGGALPAGLDGSTLYWIDVVDASTLTLRAFRQQQAVVPFTTDGTGVHTLTRLGTLRGIFETLRANKPIIMENATDIDNLA